MVRVLAFLLTLSVPLAAPADPGTDLQLAVREAGGVRETEIYARRETALGLGPFDVVYGAAISDRGGLWAGAGLSLDVGMGGGWRMDGSVMPGLYHEGNGVDLGHTIQFRSGIGVSRGMGPGRLGLGIDHMSNGDLGAVNPGSDGIYLRYRITR